MKVAEKDRILLEHDRALSLKEALTNEQLQES